MPAIARSNDDPACVPCPPPMKLTTPRKAQLCDLQYVMYGTEHGQGGSKQDRKQRLVKISGSLGWYDF